MAAKGFGKWINIAFKRHNVISNKSLCSGIALLSGFGHLLSSRITITICQGSGIERS